MSDDGFYVELPGGGAKIPLQTKEEVDRWTSLAGQYIDQYDLRKVNDLTNLGTLLVQHISLFRAQLALSGRVPELDDDDLPTGRMISKRLKPAEIRSYQAQINDASKEIREIEKQMGIDKKSRDAAGDETIGNWLVGMKARAHRYGLHVSERARAFEELAMEARWRVRLNEIGDAEDRHYEDCTDEGIVRWLRGELAKLEQKDKEFAQEEGALVLGSAV